MEIDNIKSRLIMIKNDPCIKREIVSEIQEALLNKKKESEFSELLKKVEYEVKNNQSIRK